MKTVSNAVKYVVQLPVALWQRFDIHVITPVKVYISKPNKN